MAYLGVGPSRVVGEALQMLLDARMEVGPIEAGAAYARLDEWAHERGLEPAGEKLDAQADRPA